MSINPRPAVILAGGSEIVALSVAEQLLAHGIPLWVISLGQRSLLKGLPLVQAYIELKWPPENLEHGISQLMGSLKSFGIENYPPLPVFATEDGGLRLLFEGRQNFEKYLIIGGAKALPLGGLDKAELFTYLEQQGLSAYIAPTIVLEQAEQAEDAIEQFGLDVVFKPALKPLSMQFKNMQSKVITRQSTKESKKVLITRLEKAWGTAERWVAQPKLNLDEKGENSWCGFCDNQNNIKGITLCENWKQPRMGGSACWVEINKIDSLSEAVRKTIQVLAVHGILEISFLQDEKHQWRMLELNPRPWLQIALPDIAGYPLVYWFYQDACGEKDYKGDVSVQMKSLSWVNPERMLIAASSGEYGHPLNAIFKALKIIYQADYLAVYSSSLPKVKRRWLLRILNKLLSYDKKNQ